MITCEACGREYEARVVTHGTVCGHCPHCRFDNYKHEMWKVSYHSVDNRTGHRVTVPTKVIRILPPVPEPVVTPYQRGTRRTYRGDRKPVYLGERDHECVE